MEQRDKILGDGRLRQFGSGRAFGGGALFLPFLNSFLKSNT